MSGTINSRLGLVLRCALAATGAATTLGLVSGATMALPASAATVTRQAHVCYSPDPGYRQVCLYTVDSYNGAGASGYVSKAICNPGADAWDWYICGPFSKGSYWTGSMWEDWLNYKVTFVNSELWSGTNCIYLRVDTRPNGFTTYQDFKVYKVLDTATC
jgi:hypothetical protein